MNGVKTREVKQGPAVLSAAWMLWVLERELSGVDLTEDFWQDWSN